MADGGEPAGGGQDRPANADASQLEARLTLADLRRRMFGRSAPVLLGRYRLVRLLGRGAYGSVFEAVDTEIDRSTALKVLRADAETDDPEQSRLQLLREGQALAQLSHPNVVQVYAASLIGSHVCIAMELIRGTTLAQWAKENATPDRERFEQLRDMLEQAGQGLAAAHACGLLHRDFKPANVLVADDGRVTVADFGLARSWPSLIDADREERDAIVDAATQGVGTPRYMSPEQLRGGHVHAASDQFNFAASAWELVFGHNPFEGETRAMRLREIEAGRICMPRSTIVPRPYLNALRRALANNPADRFHSMTGLLHALRPRRTRTLQWALGGATVAAGAVAAALWATAPDQPTPCTPESARAVAETVWNPERRTAVVQGLRQTQLPDIDKLSRSVEQHVGQYTDEWVDQHVSTCTARWRDQSISEQELDGRMACLRHRLDTVDALLTRFETGQSQAAARSVDAVSSLPALDGCAQPDSTWADETAEHAALRKQLANANADMAAGRYEDAVQQSHEIVEQAERLQSPSIAREALNIIGYSWSELADDRHFGPYEDAYYFAAQMGDEDAITDSAAALAMQYAYANRVQEAERWIRHAIVRRDNDLSAAQQLALEHVRGIVHLKRGDIDEARASFEWVIERHDEGGEGSNDTRLLASSMLAQVYLSTGELQIAHELATTMYRDTVEAFGPSHPRLGRNLLLLGRIAWAQGDRKAALEYANRGADHSEQSYGKVNARAATAVLVLAWLYYRDQQYDVAMDTYRRALTTMGDNRNVFTTRILRGMAAIDRKQGRLPDALDRLQAAVSIGRELWSDDEPEFQRGREQLAEVLTELGRTEEARAQRRHIPPAPE